MEIKNDWQEKDNMLVKEYKFSDFKSAVEFVNKVAQVAESINHHPDILIYSYKNVRISTATHEESKITEKDYELAELIDKIES